MPANPMETNVHKVEETTGTDRDCKNGMHIGVC